MTGFVLQCHKREEYKQIRENNIYLNQFFLWFIKKLHILWEINNMFGVETLTGKRVWFLLHHDEDPAPTYNQLNFIMLLKTYLNHHELQPKVY